MSSLCEGQGTVVYLCVDAGLRCVYDPIQPPNPPCCPSPEQIRLVVVHACNSVVFGDALVAAGIPHVIAVNNAVRSPCTLGLALCAAFGRSVVCLVGEGGGEMGRVWVGGVG